MKKSRRDVIKLAAAGTIVAAAGPHYLSRAWANKPIRIGHVNTFSGPLAALGEQGRWGLTVAVDRINKAGGINGRKVEVIERDDAFKPAQAVREAEELILRGEIDALTGTASSGVCVQLAPLVDRYQTLYVLGTGCETTTLTGDTVEACPRHTFRPYNSTKSQAIAMAPWALKHGIKTATCIYMDFAWGQSVSNDFRDEFVRLGGKWLDPVPVPLNATDYLPYVNRLPKDADSIILGMSGGAAIKTTLALQDTGLSKKAKMVGPASACDVNTLDQQGKSAAGGFYLHRYSPVHDLKGSPFDDEHNQSFRKEFMALSKGVLPSGFAQAQFTGMNVIKAAMEGVKYQDKKKDTPRLIAWLEGEGAATPHGPGRVFARGRDNPQGDLFLRASDHQAFCDFYMTTVDDKLHFKIVGEKVPMTTTLYPSKFTKCSV
jgi:ABC-type branched-subunit amino acid transport system substrate-binding protein